MRKIILRVEIAETLQHLLERVRSRGSLGPPESLKQTSVGRAPSPADHTLMGLNHRKCVARSVFVEQHVGFDSFDTYAFHDRIWKVEDVGGTQVSGSSGNGCGDHVTIIRIRHREVGEWRVVFVRRLYE